MKTKFIFVSIILIALVSIGIWQFSSSARIEQASPEPGPSNEAAEPFVPLRADTPEALAEPADAASDESDGLETASPRTYVDRHRTELTSANFGESMMAFLDLVRHLQEHPEDFDEILAAFKDDPDLARKVAMFADAVVHEPENNLGRQLVQNAARDLLSESGDAAIRNFALATLSKFPPADLETVDLVARASREGSFDETHTATMALANWLHEPGFRAKATEELIRTSYVSTDAELRSYAIGEVVSGNPDLSAPVLGAVNDYFGSNPPTEYRLALASTLATANEEVHSLAIGQLQTAYRETSHVELQRSTLTALAIYGGREAVAWAQQFPTDDPRLAQDLEDYLGILNRGITEPNEILDLKEEVETERALRR